MSTPLVEIKNMDLAYQKQLVLSNVSLSVYEKDFIGIIGPNGGGKTSLIKAILGLLKPVKGTIKHSLDSSEIGYLPQGSKVDESFPITVREVISSGLEHGLKLGFGTARNRRSKVEKALETVGMEALHSRSIGELSGGECIPVQLENFPEESYSAPCWQELLYLPPAYWSWTSQTHMSTISLKPNSMLC